MLRIFVISLFIFFAARESVLAQAVIDSVRMNLQMYSWNDRSSCGAGIVATWPNVLSNILDREGRYGDYGRVATEGMYIPTGYGEAYSNPELGFTLQAGYLGHNPQLGGSKGLLGDPGDRPAPDCSDVISRVQERLSGAWGLLNAQPFRITEWYATYSVPDGSVVALFEWRQEDGLEIAFDASFESDQSRVIDVRAPGNKRPVSSYAWDFGDGQSGSGARPNHTYAEAGEYEVTLTVEDDEDNSDSQTLTVHVEAARLSVRVRTDTPEAREDDEIELFASVTNSGTEPVVNVRIRRLFTYKAVLPDELQVQGSQLWGLVLEPVPLGAGESEELEIERLEPGESVDVNRLYLVKAGATYRLSRNDPFKPGEANVNWLSVFASGETDEGDPVSVTAVCEEEPCDDLTVIKPHQLEVPIDFADVDHLQGGATQAHSGLKRRVSTTLGNWIVEHRVPRLGVGIRCISGCVDVLVTVLDDDGEPVSGAEVELSATVMNWNDVVTPEGDAFFCTTDLSSPTCGRTLKLPPTDSDGRADAVFWLPGVVDDVPATVKAVASSSKAEGEQSESITVLPTPIDFGKTSSSPGAGTMAALTAAVMFEKLSDLAILDGWCTWAVEELIGRPGYMIEDWAQRAVKAGTAHVCGNAIGEIDKRKGTAIEKKIELLTVLNLAAQWAQLAWFLNAFELSGSGTAEIILESVSPPFVGMRSDFVDAVKGSLGAMILEYVMTGRLPHLTLDLHEVSYREIGGKFTQALHYRFRNGGGVDKKELIRDGYDAGFFLRQTVASTELASPAEEGDEVLSIHQESLGKMLSAAESDSVLAPFRIGHVVTIDRGLPTEESVQIVGGTQGELHLSVPLKFAHTAGATVVQTDSLAVGPPEAPLSPILSGLPGWSQAPTLTWHSRAPAMNYTVEISTDSLFSDVVQMHENIAEPTVTLDELEDRRRYYWRASAINLAGQGEWMPFGTFFTGRPVGDDLEEAVSIDDEIPFDVAGWVIGTTPEAQEADASCGSGSNSFWFTYVPTSTRRVAIESFNSGFDTVVSIWTGSAHPLTEVACNDDYADALDRVVVQSYVEFEAEEGVTYYVRVTGRDDAEGLAILQLRAPTQVSVEDGELPLPNAFAVSHYPNPMRGIGTLELDLPVSGDVRVEIFDLLGRRIETAHEGGLSAGRHVLPLTMAEVPAGIYLIRVETSDESLTRRVTLVR